MRVILTLALLFLVTSMAGLEARDDRATAGRTSMRGILVVASNTPGEADPRLQSFESTLRRMFRFASYRAAGEASAAIDIPGKGSIALGQGQRLDVETEPAEGNAVRAKVRWAAGDRTHMNTVLVLKRGVPAVLGGPSTGGEAGEVYIVIILAQ